MWTENLSDNIWTAAFSVILIISILGNTLVLWTVLGEKVFLKQNSLIVVRSVVTIALFFSDPYLTTNDFIFNEIRNKNN
jgi:hypothetical protein